MRLINVNTLALEEFWDDQIPPYAILSHTWGIKKEEVTFSDINGATMFQKKTGYRKIEYLCKEAANRGLLWAWCDTCCIDKESSAELSESINSMFKWYQQANICFVYLSDIVKVSIPEATSKHFSQSRWFTRGWTLQELLAPNVIEFYTVDWAFLGTREDNAQMISKATGINRAILMCPWAIENYSIATRLSWASRRDTTRAEDRAYSLLGILGVHMPLLYGEGKNAFRRLLAEVIKISADETVFAHSGSNILPDGPENYGTVRRLVPLSNHSDLNNYQISNTGLHIHMKILNYKSNKCFGILNCHLYQNLDHYVAIPLKRQPNDAVFIRTDGEYQLISESYANQVKPSKILILLGAPQISDIYCILRHKEEAHWNHNLSIRCSSYASEIGKYQRVTLMLDPRKESKYEILEYQFNSNKSGQSFMVRVIFDLEESKAGVLIVALSTDAWDAKDVYAKWNSLGRPSEAKADFPKIQADPSVSVTLRVIVSIRAELKLHRTVWVVTLETQRIVPSATEGSTKIIKSISLTNARKILGHYKSSETGNVS